MYEGKSTAALTSAVCSGLGSGSALALLAMSEWYGDHARRSAGLGAIWGCGHGCMATLLCLCGIFFGIIALATLNRSAITERRMAWVGIGLGCSPFVLFIVALFVNEASFLR